MRKSILLTVLIFVILVSLKDSGNSKNIKNVYEIKTEFGTFPLHIPNLFLPEYKKVPLVKVQEVNLPELPDWYESRYIPDNPSWLDKAGKFYKEGLESFFLGDLKIALKRFQSVIQDYPETKWFYLSWFWHGQVSAKQSKFKQAGESIAFFLDSLSSENNYDFSREYKEFGIYTLVWLSLKQRKFNQALLLIEKFEPEINSKKLQNKFHYLK